MKIRGRSGFVNSYAQASKELRTGKKKSGLGGKKKRTEKEKSIQRRRTGFLVGALSQLFKK